MVCLMLLLARSAAAQAAVPRPASSPVFLAASFGLRRNSNAAEPCVPRGNGGGFCGNVAGTTPGVVGMLGVFITRQIALEVEGSLAKSRDDTSSYDGLSHTDSDITSGTYTHSDKSVAALLRVRAGSAHGPSLEPVIGAIIIQGTDSLSQQTRVIQTVGNPAHSNSRPDSSTDRSAAGIVIGADVVSPPAHGVSFVASFRARWVAWPERTTSSYNPSPEQVVPRGVGVRSITIGAGIRFGGR